jgi:SAM-dependent methyltransferase
VADRYADGTYRWWHLSGPSPELMQALADGWLPAPGRALDVGCGLGSEGAHLHGLGWRVVGLDLSAVALGMAATRNPGPTYVRADVRRTPLKSSTMDACLDRGCFHYLVSEDRAQYAAQLRRVLRPGGKLLLRASLRAAGVRNDIDENVIRSTFSAWRIDQIRRDEVPSDTRTLDMLVVRLAR